MIRIIKRATLKLENALNQPEILKGKWSKFFVISISPTVISAQVNIATTVFFSMYKEAFGKQRFFI